MCGVAATAPPPARAIPPAAATRPRPPQDRPAPRRAPPTPCRRRRGPARRGPGRRSSLTASRSPLRARRSARAVVSSACLSLNERRAFGAAAVRRFSLLARRLRFLRDCLRRHAFAALRHHVGVAARIDVPAPAALRDHDRRDRAVEEIAVVRDEQHRAGIVVDHLFQQIERFEIEIVGRFVEHQQVRGFGERARERRAARARRRTAPTPRCRPVRARTGSPSCSRRRGASARRRTR